GPECSSPTARHFTGRTAAIFFGKSVKQAAEVQRDDVSILKRNHEMDVAMKAEASSRSRRDTTALVLYVAGIVVVLLEPWDIARSHASGWSHTVIFGAGVVALVVGFVLRTRKVFTRLWKSWLGKVVTVMYSALAAVVAAIPARHIVAGALHLPSTDFPITLSFWTVLCTPQVWLAGAAVAVTAGYALLLCSIGIAFLSMHDPIDRVVEAVANALPSDWMWPQKIVEGRGRFLVFAFLDTIAAAVVAVLLGQGVVASYNEVNHPNLVRFFAYYADYDMVTGYPGVQQKPFRLHDNGVVSYARKQSWDASIEVAHVGDASCVLPLPLAH
ncbi:conserved hypothetical protein, partial [Ricinus communis]